MLISCYCRPLAADERTCPPNTFTCNSTRERGGYPCIPLSHVCNGEKDCARGEDEMQNCPPMTCKAGQFQCAAGFCIREEWLCDHDDDCGDGSDEPANCSEWRGAGMRDCLTRFRKQIWISGDIMSRGTLSVARAQCYLK